MTTTQTIQIGDRVRRVQGRPDSLGLVGTVERLSDPNVIGSAGDILMTVRLDDGSTTYWYTHQAEVVTTQYDYVLTSVGARCLHCGAPFNRVDGSVMRAHAAKCPVAPREYFIPGVCTS